MTDADRDTKPAEESAEDIVARTDPDRFVAALFAPPGRRRGLIALYLFNAEVARIRDLVHEPLVGHIRLGWWREQIAAIYEQRATAAPLARLHQTIDTFALPRDLFEAYLDARAFDLNETPFSDEPALEAYTASTAGSLMQFATRVCGTEARADSAAHHAAIAYAYAGFIRSLAFDAARRFCRLPLDWLAAEGLNAEDLFAAKATPQLRKVIERLATAARRQAETARAEKFPTSAIAALAPAALVDVYLKRSLNERHDLFAKPVELSQAERAARIAFAALTWRI